MHTSHASTALIRKLESIADLSHDETEALTQLPMTIRQASADETIVREGDRPSECCLIVEGLTCRYKMTGEGKRQIHAFHIPGDIPDLQSLHLKVMDHSLGTLVPSTLAFISHQSMRQLCRAFPNLADAFWRDTLIDGAIFREWMTSIGRRNAKQRIAHLVCELLVKFDAIGRVRDGRFELPITQTEVGDALGLSTVHVNRSLQELRATGLIRMGEGSVSVLDRQGLERAGDFDRMYLHLDLDEAA